MRTDLEARLRARQIEDGYLFPDYEAYSFANVPDTVGAVIGADAVAARPLPGGVFEAVDEPASYDRVLVVVVDGFGLAYWQRHDHPLLDRLEESGTVTPLTSTYPSETAAAMTTFHTGRQPASHGVIGWDVYDPVDDAAYEAFTGEVKAGDDAVDRDMQAVFHGEPIYPAFAAAGVDCRHVVPFADTYDGATSHSYHWNRAGGPARRSGPDANPEIKGFDTAIADAFAAANDPAYLFAYLPQIDAAAHAEGTDSEAFAEAVTNTFDTLEDGLAGLAGGHEDTLVVVTADHGLVDTVPGENVDLEAYEAVIDRLERHANGEPVRYAGSPRNLHLHLRDAVAEREHVKAALEDALDARLFGREAVLERDLFGDGPTSEIFRRRLGDLVVCHQEKSVWFGSDPDHLELVGVHGGLHPDEMLVPFAASDLAALVP